VWQAGAGTDSESRGGRLSRCGWRKVRSAARQSKRSHGESYRGMMVLGAARHMGGQAGGKKRASGCEVVSRSGAGAR